MADQRTHARSEERAHAIEGAVPFDLDRFGDLALRRALFEPHEKRGQAEDPGDDDGQARRAREIRVNHGGGRAERRRVVQPPHDRGQRSRSSSRCAGASAEGRIDSVMISIIRIARAALSLHQLIDELADHAGQQIIGGEQQQDGDEAEPETARTEHIESRSPDRVGGRGRGTRRGREFR